MAWYNRENPGVQKVLKSKKPGVVMLVIKNFGATQTWVCNFMEQTLRSSTCDVLLFLDEELSLIVKERKAFDHIE